MRGVMPTPSSRTISSTPASSRRSWISTRDAACVPGDVRDRLLGDAVEDQLLLLRQRQAGLEPAFDPDAGLVVKGCRQCREGAGQPEVLECLGSERTDDPPYVLGAAARGLAQLFEILAKLFGDPRGEAFDLEHDARERLADLVVQLARHTLTLALLDHQGPTGALALLGLQPVEHLVEGVGERGDLRASLDVDALAGRQRVMPAHMVRQLVEAAGTPDA